MIVAVAAFSLMDMLLKLLTAHYPPLEVAVLRGAASLPFMLLPVLLRGRWRELRPHRPGIHLLRSALYVVSLVGFIFGVRALSLANAYAVFLSAPLFVAALSGPLLKERISTGNWAAILIGLAGVLVILRPSAESLATWGALAALAAAVGYALSVIAIRVLTRTDSTASVVFWTVSLMTLFTALLAAPGWVPIAPAHGYWLLALGVLAAIAQYLFTEAFRSAPPAVIAPFEYTSLLWGVGLDRLVWHVLPSARVLLGGGVVIASGLYLICHEHARASPEPGVLSWKWTTEKGRMLRRSAGVEVTAARQQKEESP
ncbi:MAG: DMT family transporter [Gammaproteobacteria bacterium]|nr:DMT family transporter [Gammaproteobacteria bacterium]MBV8496627.1 DMT family transporter [Gammaproteobacteria bacterium]